jgi:hypothetical protein
MSSKKNALLLSVALCFSAGTVASQSLPHTPATRGWEAKK